MTSRSNRGRFTTRPRFKSAEEAGVRLGFRSGLEEVNAADLLARGIEFDYEAFKIKYVVPARVATYTPDFRLRNGIIVETKGEFTADDRQKHLLVQAQHPDLDIRFVFSRSANPIRKGSPTTYACWCRTNGFLFADKRIPEVWLLELPDPVRLLAIENAGLTPSIEEWAIRAVIGKRSKA